MDSVAMRRGKRNQRNSQCRNDNIELTVQQSPHMVQKSVHPAGQNAKETAPTLQIALQESKQIIESQKREIATLKERGDMLTEERNYLRERLKEALALKSNKGEEVAVSPPVGQTPGKKKQESDETDSLSCESSDSETSDSESTEVKKAKKKCNPKPKKVKKVRVKTPDDSIRRYNMVLEKIKKERISKAEAYSRLYVDRNTIVSQAPIAELAATNPDLFNTLRSSFKRKDSLKRFAETCRGFCEQEPTATAILKKKDDGLLLDIYKI